MKQSSLRNARAMRRRLAAVATSAAVLTLAGCDSASDPDVIDVKELKYPSGLKITDLGDGALQLSWYGANNEEDFDGYNVYGMQMDTLPSGLTEGESLQLTDSSGNAIAAAKTILSKFNYDPEKKLTEPGTTEKGKVAAMPMHTLNDKDPLLPTCKNNIQPDKRNLCSTTTKTNVGKDVNDDSGFATNGQISLNLAAADWGIVPDKQYCFLVLSSMDEGEEVSQTSSNVECVTPHFVVEDVTMAAGAGQEKQFDILAYTATCTSAPCAAPGTTYIKAAEDAVNAAAPKALYYQPLNSGATPFFVAGKNSAIQDLGYYAGGFEDATLPKKAPKLTLGTTAYGSGTSERPVQNVSGYSLAGQSVYVQANHMYVVAVGDGTATTQPTSFKYQWLYVTAASGASVTFDMRVTNLADVR